MTTRQAAPIGPDGQRVRTAWSDPDHVRLTHPAPDELAVAKECERLRGPDPDDPWATGAGDES